MSTSTDHGTTEIDLTTSRGERIEAAHAAGERQEQRESGHPYLRFVAMIAASMVAMYVLTYANTFELAHVDASATRAYMTTIMGGSMIFIMWGFMRKMYTNTAANIALLVIATIMMVGGIAGVRTQTFISDEAYMRGMIPHHSIAVLTSNEADLDDVRVAELAQEIIDAQVREIAEMKWLIDDINTNGKARTDAEADARPVPKFGEGSIDASEDEPTTR